MQAQIASFSECEGGSIVALLAFRIAAMTATTWIRLSPPPAEGGISCLSPRSAGVIWRPDGESTPPSGRPSFAQAPLR